MVNGLERGQNRSGQTRMEAIVETSGETMVTTIVVVVEMEEVNRFKSYSESKINKTC